MSSGVIYIPIKENSQRVLGKNFRKLGDSSLWRRTVDKFSEFKIFIDTDSNEILEECKEINNVEAFEREIGLRGDKVSVCDLLLHFIEIFAIL